MLRITKPGQPLRIELLSAPIVDQPQNGTRPPGLAPTTGNAGNNGRKHRPAMADHFMHSTILQWKGVGKRLCHADSSFMKPSKAPLGVTNREKNIKRTYHKNKIMSGLYGVIFNLHFKKYIHAFIA